MLALLVGTGLYMIRRTSERVADAHGFFEQGVQLVLAEGTDVAGAPGLCEPAFELKKGHGVADAEVQIGMQLPAGHLFAGEWCASGSFHGVLLLRVPGGEFP